MSTDNVRLDQNNRKITDELIQSVSEVFKDKKYNIPDYQRGYKWKAEQVLTMLEDINEFNAPDTESDNRFYCLQNITIIENNSIYDVIDGQQRLTTLAILLSYLGGVDLVKDKIQYSIRNESHDFLKKYVFIEEPTAHEFYQPIANAKENEAQGRFSDCIDSKYDRQDVFHFVQASYIINNWIFEHCSDKEIFKNRLLDHVKLIVNKVDTDSQEKIFSNLNSNKIPLTDTDLIRAILITRCAILDSTTDKNTSDIVNANEKRVRLGWELDQFHIWWSDTSVFTLFSKLVNKGKEEQYIEGIELLYRLYFNKSTENKSMKEIREDIEKPANIQKEFDSMSQFHHTMQDWYQDSEIYHYLGFLSFHGGVKIDTLWTELWTEWTKDGQTRAKFKTYLKTEIWKTLNRKEEEEGLLKNIDNIKHSWYEDSNRTTKILVLLDIISITTIKQNKESQRLPITYFNKKSEDLEHIFCQTPNESDIEIFLGNKEDVIKQITSLVEKYKEIDNSYTSEDKLEQLKNLLERPSVENKEEKEELINQYISILDTIPIRNSIGNLLLLDSSINRSYGNDEYLQKRLRITEEAQKGEYIRPHTWKVFTKTFNSTIDLNQWTIDVIKANTSYIKKQVEGFFKDIPKEKEGGNHE